MCFLIASPNKNKMMETGQGLADQLAFAKMVKTREKEFVIHIKLLAGNTVGREIFVFCRNNYMRIKNNFSVEILDVKSIFRKLSN